MSCCLFDYSLEKGRPSVIISEDLASNEEGSAVTEEDMERAMRMGKQSLSNPTVRFELTWDQLWYTINKKKKKEVFVTDILKGISGSVKPGEVVKLAYRDKLMGLSCLDVSHYGRFRSWKNDTLEYTGWSCDCG
jgi:hypothetical protein